MTAFRFRQHRSTAQGAGRSRIARAGPHGGRAGVAACALLGTAALGAVTIGIAPGAASATAPGFTATAAAHSPVSGPTAIATTGGARVRASSASASRSAAKADAKRGKNPKRPGRLPGGRPDGPGGPGGQGGPGGPGGGQQGLPGDQGGLPLGIAGIFTVTCRYSHSAMDDPIVKPGQPGASHLHDFFANITTDANSTADTLQAGLTTCGERADRSAYWVPAVLLNGSPVTPVRTTVYYRGARGQQVTAFPTGFKLVTPRGDQTTRWSCNVGAVAVKRGLSASDVPTCDGLEQLVAHVRFPSCWDGTSLDSADHMSHAVYPGARSACPADHATRLPELVVNVRYPLSVKGGPGLTLTSGDAASMHSDVFSAWTGTRQQRLIDVCLNAHAFCGPAGFIN